MVQTLLSLPVAQVALRKESVDRNFNSFQAPGQYTCVALRKESVDRNSSITLLQILCTVALRKESVDRNNNISDFG